jgi:hypothetical protein
MLPAPQFVCRFARMEITVTPYSPETVDRPRFASVSRSQPPNDMMQPSSR